MPVNKKIGTSQATISSFFPPSPAKTVTNKRAISPVHIDLTVDSDGEPPLKKTRTSGPGGVPYTTPVAGLASGTTEHGQWRFTPTYLDTSDLHPINQRTEADVLAQKERRDAFKKKLLLENNRFLPRKADVPVALDESESEESDHAFRELNEMFSNNAKGKGKGRDSILAKSSKKPTMVGPSGQAYTPLENQILDLKKENPGTVLMVEVGYRYKFFGDDAKVAAKELGMVAFNDRNFLVASIPIHRRDIHLKKYVQNCLGLDISRALKASITGIQSRNSRSNGNCSVEKGK